MNRVRLIPLLISFLIGLVIWFLPPPEGIEIQGWHLFAIFVATIIGIMAKPLPMGGVALLALTAVIATGTVPFNEAITCFSNEIVWLVVFAFFIARGIIKTGLGTRLAYVFVGLFGKKTLGLGYGMVLTELILAPAIPSTTARAGGVIFPILRALSKAFGSEPGDESSAKIGTFLTQVAFQATCITSAMFVTAMAGNPLVVQLAGQMGINITWGSWALAAIVPGLLALIFMPLVIYLLWPPQIKETPHAKELSKAKLAEMGKMSVKEWLMVCIFILLLVLWIFGPAWGVKATFTALIGVCLLLLTEILSWQDILKEESAWDTLIWFATLVMLACNLNKFGLTSWFSNWVVGQVDGYNWMVAFLIICLLYYYSHYFFASNVAHLSAMYPPFLIISVALGAPPMVAALLLGFISNLFGGLTHYGCGPAPILYGAGYVPIGQWWKAGFLISLLNIVIWFIIGALWWKVIGLW